MLTAEDLKEVLDDYYEEKGWDIEAGIPMKSKLIDLDLEDIAEDERRRNCFLF